jgi:hypothetical protein
MVGLNVLDRAPARRPTTGREPVVLGRGERPGAAARALLPLS